MNLIDIKVDENKRKIGFDEKARKSKEQHESEYKRCAGYITNNLSDSDLQSIKFFYESCAKRYIHTFLSYNLIPIDKIAEFINREKDLFNKYFPSFIKSIEGYVSKERESSNEYFIYDIIFNFKEVL